MKKLVSILFSIICLLSISVASASTEKEITFNNIEWGSPIDTAIKSFNKFKFTFNKKSSEYWAKNMDYYMNYFFGESLNKRGYIGYVVELDRKNLKTKAAFAGYDVDDIKMYFVKNAEPSGKLSSFEGDTRLFFAYYYFSNQEGKKAYAAIKKKLTEMYGNPDGEDTFLGNSTAYWIGAHDTQAWLYLDNNMIADDEIYLKAGYMKADKWLKEAEEAYLLNPKSGNSTGGIPLGK